MAPDEPTTTLSPLNKTKARGSATNLLTEADDAISVQARKFMSVAPALQPHSLCCAACMPIRSELGACNWPSLHKHRTCLHHELLAKSLLQHGL